jgi:hypothetical protein
MWPDNLAGRDPEWGFPYKLATIFTENCSTSVFEYTVVPAWSKYTFAFIIGYSLSRNISTELLYAMAMGENEDIEYCTEDVIVKAKERGKRKNER